jgi:VanZ family protein
VCINCDALGVVFDCAEDAPPSTPIKARHCGLSRGTLGDLRNLAYPRQVAFVCLIVLGSAVLLEILQLLTPGRHGRAQDAIEKMAGGVVGIVIGRAILYFDQARRWFQN